MSKKRTVEEDQSSASDASDDDVEADEVEGDDDDEEGEEVQVDFMAKVPCEEDFHGIKALLRMLFRASNIDLSGASDHIIAHANLSSVVKLDDDAEGASAAGAAAASAAAATADDSDAVIEGYDATESKQSVYGMMSIVELSDRKAGTFQQQIVDWVLSRCADRAVKDKFSNSLSKGSCGLVFSERFTNIPFHVAVPLYKALLGDMADAKVNVDHVWMITKLYESTESMGLEDMGPGPERRKKKKESVVRYFINPEDELFEEKATAKFTFSLTAGEGADSDTKMYRTVLLLPFAAFTKVIYDMEAQFQVAFTAF